MKRKQSVKEQRRQEWERLDRECVRVGDDAESGRRSRERGRWCRERERVGDKSERAETLNEVKMNMWLCTC